LVSFERSKPGVHVDLTIQVLFARVRWWRLESEKGSLHRLCGGRLLAEAETQMAAWAQAARESAGGASTKLAPVAVADLHVSQAALTHARSMLAVAKQQLSVMEGVEEPMARLRETEAQLAEAETQMAAWAQAARDSPSVASDEAVRVPHLCCWNYRVLFCVVSMGCAVVVYVVYTSYAHARPQNLAEQRRYV
jgi:hypothetical protein